MAYVKKIIAQDEKLVGIARLHWIYVLKGLTYFLGLAFVGWGVDQLITRGLFFIGQSTGANAVSVMLMAFSHNAMLFLMGGGAFIFMLFVIKVLVTEVALTNRRVILKEGLLFVKVKQIDLEEIRGENMDSGHLGRLLGYAYIMLDCRFIGDVRLPAIESPERFMRALHQTRGVTADTLSVALGRGTPMAVGVVQNTDGPDSPQPNTPQPTPEIQPGQEPNQPEVQPGETPRGPEIPAMPTPHSPPPAPNLPPQPEAPPAQPTQPIAPPPPTEPPLQPPSGVAVNAQTQIVPPIVAQSVNLPPEAVAQVIAQVMPQMAEQVVKQMAEQGLVAPEKNTNDDIDIDTDLIESFDDAAKLDKGVNNDLHNKMEHAIH
jgi:hypothetical protein